MTSNHHHKPPLIGMPLQRGYNDRHVPIFGHRRSYLHALQLAGAAPITIPLEMDEKGYRAIFERLDGVFLSGGEDIHPHSYGHAAHPLLGKTDPERDRVEILFARWAVDEGKPLFGVCRGHQLMSVALGGTMFQDIAATLPDAERHDFRSDRYPRNYLSHSVVLNPDSKVARIFGAVVEVNSLHHQAIDRLGQGLRTVGTTPSGIIEAVELDAHPFAVGVQWHPEELTDIREMLALFQAFIEVCQGIPVSMEYGFNVS